MKIADIIKRKMAIVPWVDGEKIPWNDPGLSRRILASHLSQDTDWASRRFDLIEQQMKWITSQLAPHSRILDLACGPGFYTQRLCELGHDCVGVDFSPAAIEYAKQKATESGFSPQQLTYILQDIREYQPDREFDCVLMIFGEINVFTEADARKIFASCAKALKPGGLFILEGHTFNGVRDVGLCPATWWHCDENEGLLSEEPHICLQENFWDEALSTSTTRYFTIDAKTSDTRMFCASMTAYTNEKYEDMLIESGFEKPKILTTQQWPVGAPFEGQMLTFSCLKK